MSRNRVERYRYWRTLPLRRGGAYRRDRFRGVGQRAARSREPLDRRRRAPAVPERMDNPVDIRSRVVVMRVAAVRPKLRVGSRPRAGASDTTERGHHKIIEGFRLDQKKAN